MQLHGSIMTGHLRGKQMRETKQREFLQLALGYENYDELMASPLTPTSAIAAISLGISQRLNPLDFQESTLLEQQLGEIVCNIAKCEMMLRTPIP